MTEDISTTCTIQFASSAEMPSSCMILKDNLKLLLPFYFHFFIVNIILNNNKNQSDHKRCDTRRYVQCSAPCCLGASRQKVIFNMVVRKIVFNKLQLWTVQK
mmetsp:Transcript_18962/g.23882  ORF Transcript_18962/g.23882 Transcript_18962/m.23882 type:complete len:102 (-) Transcript_18962:181-486(-)